MAVVQGRGRVKGHESLTECEETCYENEVLDKYWISHEGMRNMSSRTKMAVVLKKRSILLTMGIGKLFRGMVVLCIKLGKINWCCENNV